ncbi:hypothetical protein [Pseudoduganella aquatica]|uniref:Uncharacterized protein n=2 Tax=Pseudoduganella aquatica TaxID=2660641 RepID=A0A7X4HBK6_9BURK|nr:hypothetical protein [Pseudoduganella aquatica]MYN07537.1 hypothetical protein [Pseudoduganella aquatica]
MSASQAAASCTLTPGGVVTDVPVSQMVSVTYTFDTSASGVAKLQIPYAVEINGTVLPEFAEKPRPLGDDRQIKLSLAPGTKIALYLNSDAHPAYRTQPVYAVQARTRDVEVTITERLGRGNTETATFDVPTCIQTTDGKRFDKYDATLTGDIWMKVSHRYTTKEVAKIIGSDTDPIIRAAVLSIYSALTNNTLNINFPGSAALPAQSISVTFEEQQNVSANISYCPLLSHVLPRTHPNCYLALISEAREASITKLKINSAWRPSLGSIVHRAGLGLDVTYIESSEGKLSIERKSLSDENKKNGTNVTQQEKELFKELQSKEAIARQKSDEAKLLETAAKKSPMNSVMTESSRSAKIEAEDALRAARKAKEDWTEKLSADEPPLIKSFRSRLSRRKDVHQILDPWYMDFNTSDKNPGKPNAQQSDAEKGHNNHLHITTREPKIL